MQTFLPDPSFKTSARVLDFKRLGKQIVEAKQILDCLAGVGSLTWRTHPVVKMWKGYEEVLKLYYNAVLDEWLSRGYKNSMKRMEVDYNLISSENYPPWLGDKAFHLSHQSKLVKKFPRYYRKFYPDVPDNLSYIWAKEE